MEEEQLPTGIITEEHIKHFRGKLALATDPEQIKRLTRQLKDLEDSVIIYRLSRTDDTNHHYYF